MHVSRGQDCYFYCWTAVSRFSTVLRVAGGIESTTLFSRRYNAIPLAHLAFLLFLETKVCSTAKAHGGQARSW